MRWLSRQPRLSIGLGARRRATPWLRNRVALPLAIDRKCRFFADVARGAPQMRSASVKDEGHSARDVCGAVL